MEIVKTKLDSVLLIKLDVFEDFRGFWIETYNEKEYQAKGIGVKFVQDDLSISSKNVLRGIHGDAETWKLLSCPLGKLYVVIVNCNESSEDFGKWESFTLSENNRHQLLVPPKFGVGHLVLSDKAILQYKQSTYYNPEVLKQFTYKYNDPRFKIWWPIKNPIVSERDEVHKENN